MTPWQNLNTWYSSPDISAIIQEIVNQSGWSSGNSLVISCRAREAGSSVMGIGVRAFASFDNGLDYTPKLEVTYETTVPKISGYVYDEENNGVKNINIIADNGAGSVVTDSYGYYQIFVPYNWSGTIAPNKVFWEFAPQSIVFNNITSDINQQNFATVFTPDPNSIFIEGGNIYPTIQAAVNAAENGDEVIITPGTYQGSGNRDIDCTGKAITIRSVYPNDPNIVNSTLIDCQGSEADPHRAFTIGLHNTNKTVLSGFKIINGYVDNPDFLSPLRHGGAVSIIRDTDGTVEIKNCIFINNYAGDSGGAIQSNHVEVLIDNCKFYNNAAGSSGGGIDCYGEHPLIINCIFMENNSGYYGGAIAFGDVVEGSSISIENCIIKENIARQGGGVSFSNASVIIKKSTISKNNCNGEMWGGAVHTWDVELSIENCDIRHNSAAKGGGLYIYNQSTATVINSNIVGNFGSSFGGGLYCGGSSAINLINSNVFENIAGEAGGAIDTDFSCEINIDNSILWANTALWGHEISAWEDSLGQGLPSTFSFSNTLI